MSTSLDLDQRQAPGPAAASSVEAGPNPGAKGALLPVRRARRAPAGALTELNLERPSVTLSRLQSGVGALAVALVGVGAERAALGCAYEIAASPHARTLVVDATTDPVPKPDALLWGSFKQHQRIIVDLRQIERFRRALIFVTTGLGNGAAASCALLFAVRGVDLVECRMDLPAGEGTLVVASVYNVFGELVIRSEAWTLEASLRTAAEAHGFSLPYSGG